MKKFWEPIPVKEQLTAEVQAKYRKKYEEINARPENKSVADEIESVTQSLKRYLQPAGPGAIGQRSGDCRTGMSGSFSGSDTVDRTGKGKSPREARGRAGGRRSLLCTRKPVTTCATDLSIQLVDVFPAVGGIADQRSTRRSTTKSRCSSGN